MGEGSLTIDQIQGIGGLRRSDDLFWLSEFRFFSCLGFAGISRDAQKAKDPLQCNRSQAVLGRQGSCRESPFFPENGEGVL